MAAYPIPKTTFFVGRDTELNDIAELTNNPLCRLLTLTGPGGIGKTQLAVEVAQRQNATFPDGFCLIPLQRLHSHEFIISAMVESLRCPISPNRDLFEQLLEYLSGKSLLLVTDNFEHLLEGVHLLSDILAHAPQVKILTTSRERLNIVEEWVYEVGGLSFPINERETEIEVYSAVQLFMQNARRLHHSFALTPGCKPAVIRICRLVGGMPLGIELASAWARVLPCETIADEIERIRFGIRRDVAHARFFRVDARAAQVFEGDFLVRDGFDHVGPGHEHVRGAAHHEDEVGQRGGVDRAARAGSHDGGNLRDDARSQRVLKEDVRVAREGDDALLDARPA